MTANEGMTALIIGKCYTRKNNKTFSFGHNKGEFIGYTQNGSPRFKLPASMECFIDSFDEDEFIEVKQEEITKVGFLEKWVSEDVCKEFGWDYKGEIIDMEADLDALFSRLFEQTARGCVPEPMAIAECMDCKKVFYSIDDMARHNDEHGIIQGENCEEAKISNACRQQTLTAITQAGEKMRVKESQNVK